MEKESFRILASEFVTSSDSGRDPVGGDLPRIVFTGKSNVGKSSLINSVLSRKNLAKTGKTPGKTRLINYFLVNSSFYFVDLPGYGYAAVSKKEREKWKKMINDYFRLNNNIRLVFSILDIRHKPGPNDLVLIDMFEALSVPQVIILNKRDKISGNQLSVQKKMFSNILSGRSTVIDIIPYSSVTSLNRDMIMQHLENSIK